MSLEPVVTREIAALPVRPTDAHKGQVGRVAIIGGCSGAQTMAGAPALAARAALRSGAGLVQAIVPGDIQQTVIMLEPCVTTRALPLVGGSSLAAIVAEFEPDVVAVGPGLGGSILADHLRELIEQCDKPMVIDADGLNMLARMDRFAIPNPARITLTPHPGEMKRLFDRWCPGPMPAARADAAVTLARSTGCVTVLKGAGTVVTDGRRLYVNETGNAGMATAGAGDVLTGMIAAFVGQRLEPLEAAILGVYLHGLAGDFAAQDLGQLSLTAVDIIDALPDAFAEHGH
ncbi:MAG: NAD(P)H-hydrate dehydratase [Phycisphaerales bacterium]|nr:MAG: NAD(P)H-hydrate dehydratase [Phycisphaerales bacterium]